MAISETARHRGLKGTNIQRSKSRGSFILSTAIPLVWLSEEKVTVGLFTSKGNCQPDENQRHFILILGAQRIFPKRIINMALIKWNCIDRNINAFRYCRATNGNQCCDYTCYAAGALLHRSRGWAGCSQICKHNLPHQVAGQRGSAVTSDANCTIHEEWRRYKRTSVRQRKAEMVEGKGWNGNFTKHYRKLFKMYVPVRTTYWIWNYWHFPLMLSEAWMANEGYQFYSSYF